MWDLLPNFIILPSITFNLLLNSAYIKFEPGP